MKSYNLSIDEILEKLNTNVGGLTDDEANLRMNKYGQNILISERKKSNVSKFFLQFKDLMIIILILSAIVSFVLSYINKESYIDSIIIIAIVIINGVIGFIQEMKADSAIESLKKLQVHNVKVKRSNVIKIINANDIVVGDIILLEAGDTVPADARIIWQASLKVDESSLTGESNPIEKGVDKLDGDVSLADRNNMIFSGTSVVYGKCTAVVTSIGMNTELGIIAKSINNDLEETTPLQKKIDSISKFLSLVIFIIIVIMFLVGLIEGMEIKQVIMLSISLAVAAIPEGLPAVITITLSLGVSVLAKKKAIVRKISSVETLGCTEIICSDKTGTITQNKMKIMEVYCDDKLFKSEDKIDNELFINMLALNNDVSENDGFYIGDPTEVAIYEYCIEQGLDIQEVRNTYKRIDEVPFDSIRKMMSTINQKDDNIQMITKGSFDSIIDKCTHIIVDGKLKKITNDKKRELKNIEVEESNKAYRVLAYAYRNLDLTFKQEKDIEKDLIFIGMVGMIDPPRDNVRESIEMCKKAHIKPIMITGDSLNTASAIAKEIGILENDNEAIIGAELDKYTEKEMKEIVKKYSVYARVSPMNKLDIVNAWKANNKVVSMTGDGVNDAPALKTANIGVGMGITGTEVSKEVSDIILADDSFTTIVDAVREGRRIFDNIRNVLVYLITGNIAEVLVVFIGMLCGVEIFLPIQLLYINLITDSVPAISLAFEKEANDVMDRDVRKNENSFFTPFIISKITVSSILKTCAILLVYFISFRLYDIKAATSMAFLCLTLTEMIFAFSCKNIKKSVINKNIFKNHFLNNSMLILLLIQFLLFFTPIKVIFDITDLTILQVGLCIIFTLFIFIVDEFLKKTLRSKFRD